MFYHQNYVRIFFEIDIVVDNGCWISVIRYHLKFGKHNLNPCNSRLHGRNLQSVLNPCSASSIEDLKKLRASSSFKPFTLFSLKVTQNMMEDCITTRSIPWNFLKWRLMISAIPLVFVLCFYLVNYICIQGCHNCKQPWSMFWPSRQNLDWSILTYRVMEQYRSIQY